MSAAKVKPHLTVEEYLTLERASRERHEYLDGDIFAMAGESSAHGHITVNVVTSLATQLRGSSCWAWTKDTKVRSGPSPKSRKRYKGLFAYPDIVIVCGEPKYHDLHKDVLLNPKGIIEVLFESTETFDRGEKFTRYQKWNPSLTDYVLVSQTRPQIEHFIRQANGGWSYHLYSGLEAEMHIASIGCTLKLAEVFERVTFAPEEEGTEE